MFILLAGYCENPDVESALDLSLVESMGVNSKNPLISNHDCAEHLVIMVDTLTKVDL
jgi:recombination protein RecA